MRGIGIVKTLLLICLVGFPFIALTQINHNNVIKATSDKAYITFGSGFGNLQPLLFEAKFTNDFYLRFKTNSRLGIGFEPKITIRMLLKENFPVLNPSFNPVGTFYYKIKQKQDSVVRYYTLRISHHSNGQSDYFLKKGKLNYDEGNFTTNFIQLGYNFAKSLKNIKSCVMYQHYSVQYNPDLVGDIYLRKYYSDFRINGKLEFYKNFRCLSSDVNNDKKADMFLSIDASLLLDDFNLDSLVKGKCSTTSILFAIRPFRNFDFALFTQIYFGEDYYNIYFVKPIYILRFGLITIPLNKSLYK